MPYLLLALLLLLIMIAIYRSYQNAHDAQKLFVRIALLITLMIFTYASKILLVYKPLLILHLALLMLAWWHYYRYIIKDILKLYWILSPLLSLTLFIIIALFFRENG